MIKNILLLGAPRAIRTLALTALLASALTVPVAAAPKGGNAGGDPTTPTDVNVTNVVYVVPLEAREPVHFEYRLTGSSLINQLNEGHYQVPSGKRLTITFVSAVAISNSTDFVSVINLSARPSQYATRAIHRVAVPAPVPTSSDRRIASISQPMHLVVMPGEIVGFGYGRSHAYANTSPADVTIHISGYLEDVL